VKVASGELSAVMGAFRPLRADELLVRWGDEERSRGWASALERPALTGGPTVNSEPSGWLWDEFRWWLVSLGAGPEILLFAAAHRGYSRTSGDGIFGTIRRLGDQVALLSVNDFDADPALPEVAYGIEDWDAEMLRVAEATLENFDVVCPSDNESDEIEEWQHFFKPSMPPMMVGGSKRQPRCCTGHATSTRAPMHPAAA